MQPVQPIRPSTMGRRPARRRQLRRAAALASAIALAGGVAACGSSSSNSSTGSSSSSKASSGAGSGTTTVTIAYTAPIADQMLAGVAQSAGLFQKNGINAKITFLQASSALPALASGQVQFAVIGAPSAEVASVNGTPLQYIAQWENAIDAEIVANKSVGAVKSMNGKTVAISSTGALSDFLVSIADQKYGIQMHEVPLGQLPNQLTAYSHGSVDALSGTNPWLLPTLEKRVPGSHVVVDFRGDEGYPGVGLVADKKWTSSNASTAIKVLKAMTEALTYYKTHPTQSIAVIVKATGETAAVATQAYDTTKAAFSNSIVPTLTDQKNVLAALTPTTPAAKGYDASKLLNASYAEQAQG